ncbi:serine carboxypeptidase [Trifolium repens]|nr:serine carboxypeptidase [Trifolium repens]
MTEPCSINLWKPIIILLPNQCYCGLMEVPTVLRLEKEHLLKWSFQSYKKRAFEANMIYLDSPVGVGFSFSVNQSFYYPVNDEMTGNPLLEFNKDFNSDTDFWWFHGQIKDSTFQMLKTICNYSTIRRQGRSGKLSTDCGYTDTFDVIPDICPPPYEHRAYVLTKMQAAAEKIDVCVEDETIAYLNMKDVYNALNAKLVGIKMNVVVKIQVVVKEFSFICLQYILNQ